jgi:putative hemolysin
MTDVFWTLALILVGLTCSAFFSGTETGLISLNRLRLRNEVERKNRRAMILNGFVENSERLLGTTLMGNTLANVIFSVALSVLVVRLAGELTIGLDVAVTIIASVTLLILGEIVPKTLFRTYAHRLCMVCADALAVFAWLFTPVVVLLGVVMRAMAGLGRKQQRPPSFFVTREELKHLAREGEGAGALTTDERVMIHGVMDFPFKTVFEVMVPLSHTITVSRESTAAEVLKISERTGYARFPVREGDRLVGVVNVYDLVFDEHPQPDRPAASVMRPPQFVISTQRVNHALPTLRAARNPMCIVVNPGGQHLGIVTIEDIVEEIVGDVEG